MFSANYLYNLTPRTRYILLASQKLVLASVLPKSLLGFDELEKYIFSFLIPQFLKYCSHIYIQSPVFFKVLRPWMPHCWRGNWFREHWWTSLHVAGLWYSLPYSFLRSAVVEARHMLLHGFHALKSFWRFWNVKYTNKLYHAKKN